MDLHVVVACSERLVHMIRSSVREHEETDTISPHMPNMNNCLWHNTPPLSAVHMSVCPFIVTI